MVTQNAPNAVQDAEGSYRTVSTFNPGLLIAPVLACFLTLWIDPSYTGGDPSLYRYVYDALGTESFGHGFFFYSTILSSTEPLHFLMTWVSSHLGIPRELFIGASSAALAYLATKLLVRRGASLLIATIITSSSFYFILLYTTTERLKVAAVFLIASALTIDRPKTAVIFAFLATAAHIQVALIYFALLTIYMAAQIRQAAITKKLPPNMIGTILAVLVVVIGAYALIGNQIASKATSYVGLGQQSDLLRVLPFYVITLIYSKRFLQVTLLFLPIIVLTPVIGYGRLNIFSYFIFLYYAVGVRSGINIGVLLTTVYFGYSSYAFLTRIIAFGEPLLVGGQ
jgi:hypothetical protein